MSKIVPTFIEIVIPIDPSFDFEMKPDIENLLDTLLTESLLGEISGGGVGLGKWVVDVEVFDINTFPEVLSLLRTSLKENLNTKQSIQIKCKDLGIIDVLN